MARSTRPRPRVLVDADVLFAGAASPSEHGASLLILRLAEMTLIQAITCQQVLTEVERNLAEKLPQALPTFRLLAGRCLQVVDNPQPADLQAHIGKADPKDLPILVSALQAGCPWLVTFNSRHYRPGDPQVRVLRPGDFIMRVRDMLAHLADLDT